MQGIIESVKSFKSDNYALAFLDDKSSLNARNDIVIIGKKIKIKICQVSGYIARHISCWVKEGDIVEHGQKYGIIHFGSHVDMFLPKTVKPNGTKSYWGDVLLLDIY